MVNLSPDPHDVPTWPSTHGPGPLSPSQAAFITNPCREFDMQSPDQWPGVI